MKQLLFYSLVLLTLASCGNQMSGSGNIITEKRNVPGFHAIDAGGAFEVELTVGPATEVRVEADDNLMPFIKTEVSGGTLSIEMNGVNGLSDSHLKVYVSSPEISAVTSSGASDIKIKNQLKYSGKLSLDVSGAGSISGAVDAPEIDADVSGAGNIEVNGRTKNYVAKITGSGDLKTADLQSENVDVDVSGAGTAHVNASVMLKAEASGAGTVIYKGGGQVQQHTSGAGTIKSE